MNVTIALWIPLVVAIAPVLFTLAVRNFRLVSKSKWDELVADRNAQRSRADLLEDGNDKLQRQVDRAEDRAFVMLQLQKRMRGGDDASEE